MIQIGNSSGAGEGKTNGSDGNWLGFIHGIGRVPINVDSVSNLVFVFPLLQDVFVCVTYTQRTNETIWAIRRHCIGE